MVWEGKTLYADLSPTNYWSNQCFVFWRYVACCKILLIYISFQKGYIKLFPARLKKCDAWYFHALTKGIKVTTAYGLTMSAKTMLLLCSADVPARAIISNMKLFNGEHGCSTCEDPGDNKSGSGPLNRVWPFQEVNVVRTKEMVYAAINRLRSSSKQ